MNSSASFILSRISGGMVLYLPLDCSCLMDMDKPYLENKYFDISERIIFLSLSSREKYNTSTLISGSGFSSKNSCGLCINKYLASFDFPHLYYL